LFQSDFKVDAWLLEDLKKRYGTLHTLEDQATVPVKAKMIYNPVGTAPGLIFEEKGKRLILMPGVPPEMRKMLADHVLPYVKGVAAGFKRYFRKGVNLFDIGESAVDPFLRELAARYPDVSIGIYPNLGLLGVNMTFLADSQTQADQALEAPLQELQQKFKDHLYQAPSGRIDEAVHLQLLRLGATLGIAESCTGGAIAARLVRHPGASEYLLGGVVAYSNAMKQALLQVPKELIQSHGAVSGEVVEAMLNGIMDLTGCDYAVAVSGVAGPGGGTPQKPVGTVWCGAAKKDETLYTWQIHARGSREMVIERSLNAVLAKLYRLLAQEES
jgi:nicotinamide-nucleotide amidase